MAGSSRVVAFVAAAMAVGATAAVAEPVPPSSAMGWIEVEPREGGLTVRGHVIAPGPSSGTAVLEIERTGAGGRMRTSQGNAFELVSGERTVVSEAGLSFTSGDEFVATLTIEADGRTITRTTLRHDAKGFSDQE